MSKSEEKRKKTQQTKEQPSKNFGWIETLHSTTHIRRDDFYRIVAGLELLAMPLTNSNLQMIRMRGEKIHGLAHKLDMFFSEALRNYGFDDNTNLVLELKTRTWKPERADKDAEEAAFMDDVEEESDLAVAK